MTDSDVAYLRNLSYQLLADCDPDNAMKLEIIADRLEDMARAEKQRPITGLFGNVFRRLGL